MRERAAGLSAGAYLCSKLAVLGVISIVQVLILVAIGLLGHPMPPQGSFLTSQPFLELILGIAVLGIASMGLGLMVSSMVNTSEKAMPFLAWLAPARWGFAAIASTANLNRIIPPASMTQDPLWNHTASTWLINMAAMIGLAVVFVLITWWRLNRLSPGRRK